MTLRLKIKRTTLMIALSAAIVIVMGGTFAWSNLMQQRINTFSTTVVPGVNLHDNFNAPNKDVFVENAGEITVFVRVRLTEYLQTANLGTLVAGQSRGDGDGEDETDIARLSWMPHNAEGGIDQCMMPHGDSISENWPAGVYFHDYYQWKMGGQAYYMPAKELLGKVEDPEDENFDRYIALLDDPPVCADLNFESYTHEDYADTESPVSQTMWADVITMADWLAGRRDTNDEDSGYWVIDMDGWCYWSKPLLPGQATGLLLDAVKRTDKKLDSDVEYCINVWMQAVDEREVDLLFQTGNGGMTDSGRLLMQTLSGGLIEAANGLYEVNRDGTFTQVMSVTGELVEASKPFVPLGTFAAQIEKVNAAEDQRLYIGDTFDYVPLEWNGELYVNYDDIVQNYQAPYYNIIKKSDGTGAYTVVGTEIGEDSQVYLKVMHVTDEKPMYLASVLVSVQGGIQTFTTTSVSYIQGYPGTGPFGFIYKAQEKDKVGSEEDTRHEQGQPNTRYFHHISNGVYVETLGPNATITIDKPVKYYFADQVGQNAFMTLSDKVTDEEIKAIFPLQMSVGDGFDLVFEWVGATALELHPIITEIRPGGTMYTLQPHMINNENTPYCRFWLGDGLYLAGKDRYGTFTTGSEGTMLDEFLKTDGKRKYKVPDYDTSGGYGNGNGTAVNPYKIRNRIDMEWLTYTVSGVGVFEANYMEYDALYISVMNDFSMGSEPFMPIGKNNGGVAEYEFEGIFNGNGYTISDLVIIDKEGEDVGLFRHLTLSCCGKAYGTQVKNLKLANVYIEGGKHVGGIAGYAESGSGETNTKASLIENCEILSGTIKGKYFVGGIVGANGGFVRDCTNNAAVYAVAELVLPNSPNTNLGGIAGRNVGTITNCVNYGDLYAHANGNHVGGIVGENAMRISYEAFVTGCTNNGDIDADEYTDYIGGIVGNNGCGAETVMDCTNTGTIRARQYYIDEGRVKQIVGYGNAGSGHTEEGEIIAN